MERERRALHSLHDRLRNRVLEFMRRIGRAPADPPSEFDAAAALDGLSVLLPDPSGTPPASVGPEVPLPLLERPAEFGEAFDGEVREMVLETLADACTAAEGAHRLRRAAVLAAVLAANPRSGELERRRETLRRTFKDAARFTDPKPMAALRRLGFGVLGGKTHWKFDYAGVRVTLAKTPSDHRAYLNAFGDLANRCL